MPQIFPVRNTSWWSGSNWNVLPSRQWAMHGNTVSSHKVIAAFSFSTLEEMLSLVLSPQHCATSWDLHLSPHSQKTHPGNCTKEKKLKIACEPGSNLWGNKQTTILWLALDDSKKLWPTTETPRPGGNDSIYWNVESSKKIIQKSWVKTSEPQNSNKEMLNMPVWRLCGIPALSEEDEGEWTVVLRKCLSDF